MGTTWIVGSWAADSWAVGSWGTAAVGGTGSGTHITIGLTIGVS